MHYWKQWTLDEDILAVCKREVDAEGNPISEEDRYIEGKDDKNNINKVLIYPEKSKSMNLAFDITPAKYVTGLITEKGICKASTNGLKQMFSKLWTLLFYL